MHGPANIQGVARAETEPTEPTESGSGVPRLRAAEETRPLELEPRRGPTVEDIIALDEGELDSVCLAEHYRLGPPIGRGGMAIVFRGEHIDSGQPVAVKILVQRDPDCYEAIKRFLREARLGVRVRHENVVEVLDHGSTPEGLLYVVMERLEGEDLRALIARHEEGLSWARVRSLMLQICEGLAAVHDAGIVHQDLKPSNCFRVLIDGIERVKLIDFGVATTIGDEASHMIIGTPQYMSPEQARGAPVDGRSDVYSAGMILCELLTGHCPFNGSPIAVLASQLDEVPPMLQQLAVEGVSIDPAVQRIFERAVAKEPSKRFSSIRELAAAIRAVEPEVESGLEPHGASSSEAAEAAQSRRSAAPRSRTSWVRSSPSVGGVL